MEIRRGGEYELIQCRTRVDLGMTTCGVARRVITSLCGPIGRCVACLHDQIDIMSMDVYHQLSFSLFEPCFLLSSFLGPRAVSDRGGRPPDPEILEIKQ